ncbi:MAG: magnesium transporter [Alphaproteobacteria bacterium]|jgi:magnesium transporter|tara:strand:- start:10 stop:387 length:378 start_codon:yes stop_codon:yes gene_type:complete
MEKRLRTELEAFEDLIFDGKDININDFYVLKKNLLKDNHIDLLEIHLILESMLDRRNDQLMNRRLNILTVWSTIFLPLSFYTGLWGMNFDDVPLISDDNGFWIFSALSIITIVGLWWYFKKHKWI